MKVIATNAPVLQVASLLALILVLGCGGYGSDDDRHFLEFRLVAEEPGEDTTATSFDHGDQRETMHLANEVLLTGAAVDSAWVERDAAGGIAVGVVLTSAGREKFARVTADHIGRRLAIVVEGEIVAAPVIRAAITGGRAQIDGNFAAAEAQRIAEVLVAR